MKWPMRCWSSWKLRARRRRLDCYMQNGYSEAMTGIHYITDPKGKRIGVQIDLRENAALWEDFYDAWLIEQRKDEPRTSWETAKKHLSKKTSQ